MTTALIAEDEPILARMLADTLARLWPQVQLLPVAPNGIEALKAALQHQPDLLFLDIRMPAKSGLEVAAELAEEWPLGAKAPPFPLLVFVTAYDEYAIQAFEQAAVDYVLKPISDTRLQSTIARLQERLKARQPGAGLDQVLQQLRRLESAPPAGASRLQMLRASVGNEVRLIPVAEVLYLEAGDKYVNVVTAQGESLVRTPLRELLGQLDPDLFWQVHRATVVNVSAVEAAERDESGKVRLRLRGQQRRLPVSRLYAHLFRQM
jgi:DNA-binding LytR/AlgR family response regulator